MANSRFRYNSKSDDEDEEPELNADARARTRPPSSSYAEEQLMKKKNTERVSSMLTMMTVNDEAKAVKGSQSGYNEEDMHPKPLDRVNKVTFTRRGKRYHFRAFEYRGDRFELEDFVLLTPDESVPKPHVAIIKDIIQSMDGNMMVTAQWLYRPEEAKRRGGGYWRACDSRELFYSFHCDEVPAESVMHKCSAHFVPLNKQLPCPLRHPGFVVQRVYDPCMKELWKVTEKDYVDDKQHEIDLLLQKTRGHLGELPDMETEDASSDQEYYLKSQTMLRRRKMEPFVVRRKDNAKTKHFQSLKSETPGICTSNTSEIFTILANFKMLTGDMHRDRCLERLLQGIQYACNYKDNPLADDKEQAGSTSINNGASRNYISETRCGSQNPKDRRIICWQESAVLAVSALEKASHDAFAFDFRKYNQKMRQLVYNLKKNVLLARRLLSGELEPSALVKMSSNELKNSRKDMQRLEWYQSILR